MVTKRPQRCSSETAAVSATCPTSSSTVTTAFFSELSAAETQRGGEERATGRHIGDEHRHPPKRQVREKKSCRTHKSVPALATNSIRARRRLGLAHGGRPSVRAEVSRRPFPVACR